METLISNKASLLDKVNVALLGNKFKVNENNDEFEKENDLLDKFNYYGLKDYVPKDITHYYQFFNTELKDLILLNFNTNPQFNPKKEDEKWFLSNNIVPKKLFHAMIGFINKFGTIKPEGYMEKTPSKIKLPLKIHQRRTLYEMKKKENTKFRFSCGYNVNLLCDNAGSGKSLTILSLIADNKLAKFHPHIYYSTYPNDSNSTHLVSSNTFYYGINYQIYDSLRASKNSIELKSNLILVPHNVFTQWQKYITIQTELKAFYISTKKSVNEFVSNNPEKICEENDIILVKSTMYNLFVSELSIKMMCDTYLKNISYKHNIEDSHMSNSDKLVDLSEKLNCKGKDIFLKLSNELHENVIDNLKIEDLKKEVKQFINELDDFIENNDWTDLNSDNNVKYVQYINIIKGFYFQRIIIDEIDSIKIPSCHFSHAKQIWYVSSSINNLIYPRKFKIWNYDTQTYNLISSGIKGTGFLREILYKMFHIPNDPYTNPSKIHYYRSLYTIVRNNMDFIKKSIEISEPVKNYIQCFTPPHIYAIKSAINPEALKALNGGDTQKAIELLGCEKSTEEELINEVTKNLKNDIQKLEKKIDDKKNQLLKFKQDLEIFNEDKVISNSETYTLNEYLSSEYCLENFDEIEEIISSNINNTKISIKKNLEKLNSLNEKLIGIESRICNISDKKCPVCFMKVNEPCISPCCKNAFCFECLTTCASINDMCPYCNCKIDLKKVNILLDNNSIADKANELPTKLEKLGEIVSNNDKKIIIFSEYDGGLENIKKELSKRSIDQYNCNLSTTSSNYYSNLIGSSARIRNIIQQFKDNKFRILLLNAKYSGAGLNLEFADEVILFHRMSKDLERQVIGRAQRIGRTSKLIVTYLCYENEYSSKCYPDGMGTISE